jgi:hypothetical protein
VLDTPGRPWGAGASVASVDKVFSSPAQLKTEQLAQNLPEINNEGCSGTMIKTVNDVIFEMFVSAL